jgi:peroxiredoxin Q/BCP
MPARSPTLPARSPQTPAGSKTSKAATTAASKTAPKAAKAVKAAAKAAPKAAPKAASKAAPKAASKAAPKLAAAPSAAAGRPGLAVGDPAPDFALAGDDGKTYSLAGLRGQRFVLYFYPRDNTPGCTTEACDFRDRHAAFTAAKVPVLGVSADGLPSHAKFRAKYTLPFPLLSDPGNAAAAAYGAYGEKSMYGRKVVGIVRSTFVVGADGRIEAAWSPVRVPGHVEAVLQSLR